MDHKLYATRGYYPGLRSTFSVATRGFSFGLLIRLGIKLLSPITRLIELNSTVVIKTTDESAL